MGMRFKRRGQTALRPAERLLHKHDTFRAITGLCLPNYRIGFPLRGVCSFQLLVTTHRILLITDLLVLWMQEIDIWFPGKMPEDQTELLTGVAVRNGLFGRCLEIKSKDPRRWRWLCASNLTLRFFFRDPESLEKIILEAMRLT